MSDFSQGPGWWQASDDKWYPPDQVPGPEPAGTDDPTTGAPPAWGAAPGGWSPPPAPGSAPAWGGPTGPSTGGYGYAPPGAGYGPMGGFATNAYGGQPSAQGQATASMVLGIVSLVLFWCWFLAFIPALVGLVLGLICLNRIKTGAASADGKGMAVAGVVCSSLSLAITAAFFVLVLAS